MLRPAGNYFKLYYQFSGTLSGAPITNRDVEFGGVDVDLLARGTPAQVRERTREILAACAPRGGFCMGSGNSLANYIKVENYYAMLEERARWNETH